MIFVGLFQLRILDDSVKSSHVLLAAMWQALLQFGVETDPRFTKIYENLSQIICESCQKNNFQKIILCFGISFYFWIMTF